MKFDQQLKIDNMLEVVGGTYLERCLYPEWDALFGSGLRAALAVRTLGAEATLHTYVSGIDLPALKARTVVGGIKIHPHEVKRTVAFEYFHGLSTPVITPPPHVITKAKPIKLTAANVLQYGFIEGDAIVHGESVVYDPQSPQQPVLFNGNGSTAGRLAIVCNRTEGRLLTNERNPRQMADALIKSQGCEAVVVKCGSHGCFVSEGGSTSEIPAFRTDHVWPIGSGDVFAAVFAKSWAVDRFSAFDAAELASKATAFFCNTKSLDFPPDFPSSFKFPPIHPKFGTKSVYLAGPFFSMSQNWLIEQAYEALRGQGLTVFSPLHHVGRGSASEVYEKDIKGLENCDIVFACCDGLDSGTVFEVGYAIAQKKPVVVFVQNETPEDLKMFEGSQCVMERDFVTAIYKTYWLATT